jgi:hypothetical protein
VVLDPTQVPQLPIAVKLGDANLDGFPDMLVIISDGNNHTPKMLFSVPCGAGVVGCGSGRGKRGWSVATKGTEVLDAVNDARSVSFLDMDEDVGSFFCYMHLYVLMDYLRELLISWYNGRAEQGRETYCSSRTISTTMHFSSRPLVRLFLSVAPPWPTPSSAEWCMWQWVVLQPKWHGEIPCTLDLRPVSLSNGTSAALRCKLLRCLFQIHRPRHQRWALRRARFVFLAPSKHASH